MTYRLTRRGFIQLTALAGLGPAVGSLGDVQAAAPRPASVTLFLSGDVMTGRGLDQSLPYSTDPLIYESYMRSARGYLELAEEASGDIPVPLDYEAVWGDALAVLEAIKPAARIINLETAVTEQGRPWPGKGIHYRMHPANVPLLSAAGIDCCVLANNHVLDWGYEGLDETLTTLEQAGLRPVGAGRNQAAAAAPAILPRPDGGRVVVFALGHPSSGIPRTWAAAEQRPGVNLLTDLSPRERDTLAERLQTARRPEDILVVSLHWGGNWGYEIPPWQRHLAHWLIDEAGVDVVHGHSSHHPKGLEVYRGRPILYGCGDLINDYEGIGGHERFRGELGLMYFPRLDPETGLQAFEMVPMRMRRFQLQRVTGEDARWLAHTLDRESRPLGGRVALQADDTLVLRWRD